MRILDAGDSAFTLEFGESIDNALLEKVRAADLALNAAIGAGLLPGVIETVPTFRSLTVLYDPLATSRRALLSTIEPLLRQSASAAAGPPRHWQLPACYEADFGLDLEPLARQTGLDPDSIAALHAGRDYRVYMLGFLPGFPFMGDLPAALHQARRSEPRLRVPPGSLAIANRLTAIYPWESPGGWHLIGYCPVLLFDARRARPALLEAGDLVRFQPVDRNEVRQLADALSQGRLDPARHFLREKP